MKQGKKRVLALLLSLAMVLSLLPASVLAANEGGTVDAADATNASAGTVVAESGNTTTTADTNTWDGSVAAVPEGSTTAFAGGDGTQNNPYQIATGAQLAYLAQQVNGGSEYKNTYFKLTNNINLDNNQWTPIGNSNHSFFGVFDGDNKTISNLTVNLPDTNGVGLFGYLGYTSGSVDTGGVKNVKIENVTLTGASGIGAVVGNAFVSAVENCHVSGDIRITGNYSVGGLVGRSYVTLTNCSVIGNNGSTITGIYSKKDLEGDNVGGLAGFLAEDTCVVSNCQVKNVSVTGTRKVGGIVGSIYTNRTITKSSVDNVTVTCSATEEYAADNAQKVGIGGIAGLWVAGSKIVGEFTENTVSNVTLRCVNDDVKPYLNVGLFVGGLYDRSDFRGPTAVESSKKGQKITTAGELYVSGNTVSGNNTVVTGTRAFSGEGSAEAVGPVVATVNGYAYTSLQAAIDAASTTEVTNIKLEAKPSASALAIANGQKINLDLNGFELTNLFIVSHGNLTLNNGTVGRVWVYGTTVEKALAAAGEEATEGVTDYSSFTLASNATINAVEEWALIVSGVDENGSFVSNNRYVFTGKYGVGATINIEGNISGGDIFVMGNLGNSTDAASALKAAKNRMTINVKKNATINTTTPAIVLNGYADLNVSDNAQITGSDGITVKRGNLNITGGTITATGEKSENPEAVHSGADYTGSAVTISSTYNYSGEIGVAISGGTLKSTNYAGLYAGCSIEKDSKDTNKYISGLSLNITGGDFKGANGEPAVYVVAEDATEGTNVPYPDTFITGGTFSTDPSDYVDDSHTAVLTQNGTYVVNELTSSNGVASIDNALYKSLGAAIKAANAATAESTDTTTITLLQNTTRREQLSPTGKVIIDLNGKTLTGTDANGTLRALTFYSGDVTIKNGTIVGRVDVYDSATVTIAEDATVKGMIVVWGDGTKDVDSDVKTPTLNVYGTVTNTDAQAISTNGTDYSKPNINIYPGATVTSTGSTAMYLPLVGKLTVTGGTITGADSAIGIKGGEVEISGGTLTATGDLVDPPEGYSNGINASGSAIQVESNDDYKLAKNGNPAPVSITIKGDATIESKKGYAIYEYIAYSSSNKAMAAKTHLTSVSISENATLTSKMDNIKVSTVKSNSAADGTAISLTGGTYSSANVSAYCATDYAAVKNSDGTYQVSEVKSDSTTIQKQNNTVISQDDINKSVANLDESEKKTAEDTLGAINTNLTKPNVSNFAVDTSKLAAEDGANNALDTVKNLLATEGKDGNDQPISNTTSGNITNPITISVEVQPKGADKVETNGDVTVGYEVTPTAKTTVGSTDYTAELHDVTFDEPLTVRLSAPDWATGANVSHGGSSVYYEAQGDDAGGRYVEISLPSCSMVYATYTSASYNYWLNTSVTPSGTTVDRDGNTAGLQVYSGDEVEVAVYVTGENFIGADCSLVIPDGATLVADSLNNTGAKLSKDGKTVDFISYYTPEATSGKVLFTAKFQITKTCQFELTGAATKPENLNGNSDAVSAKAGEAATVTVISGRTAEINPQQSEALTYGTGGDLTVTGAPTSVEGITGTITYKYALAANLNDESAAEDAYKDKITFTATDAAGTYKVFYKATDGNNGSVADGYFYVTISKATMELDKQPTDVTKAYTGSAVDYNTNAAVTVKDKNTSEYKVQYKLQGQSTYSDNLPEITNAGEYTVFYQVTADNYETITDSFTVTVTAQAYEVETTEFVAGYSLILVYTDSDVKFQYNGKDMYDVSSMEYLYNSVRQSDGTLSGGTKYKYVYGYLVKSGSPINAETAKKNVTTGATKALALPTSASGTLGDYDKFDVNGSGKIELNDGATAHASYNVMKGYDLITYMGNTLKSDVDHNKKIDVGDVDYILNNRTEK